MTIAVFVSVIGHVVIAGFYGYLLVSYIVCSLCLHTAPYGSWFFTTIPEWFGLLIVLSGSGCWSFPLALIKGHGNTKRCLRGSPIFQIYTSLPLLWSSSPVSLVIRVSHSANTVTPFSASWFRGMRSPKWLNGNLNLQFSGIIVPASGSLFHSELEPLGQQSIKLWKQEAKSLLAGH